ncbi:MAG: BatA and WFA domain-containing protein [Phycisphaeraceae bacterium]
MPILTMPLALIALASVPALLAIYWLRRQHRRRVVSSLVLWRDLTQPRQGGMQIQRVPTPWLFLLELLVLALLCLAAANPRVLAGPEPRPLAIVLDDSLSMLAEDGAGGGAVRDRAADALGEALEAEASFNARLILAGPRPQLLGEAVRSAGEARSLLEQWQPHAPAADIDRAVALAREMLGREVRILVITDRAPPEGGVDEQTAVKWWAFGRPRPNVAFVGGVRSGRGGGGDGDRVMVEIANFGDEPAAVALRLVGDSAPRRVELEASGRRRMWFDWPGVDEPFYATLGADALAIDNELVLVPQPRRVARVVLDVSDAAARRMFERAMAAMPHARVVSAPPAELRITTGPAPSRDADGDMHTWLLRLVIEDDTRSYLGPFVIDRAHPLAEGLALAGVYWAAGTEVDVPGRPIIAAGNVPLLTERSLPGRPRQLLLRFRPEHSNLQHTASFPVLLWNLIDWRTDEMPGPQQTNLRMGMTASLTLPAGASDEIELEAPDGSTRRLAAESDAIHLQPDRPGIHRVRVGDERYALAFNPFAPGQSDLRGGMTGRWGDWYDIDEPAHAQRRGYRELLALLVLLAVGLFTLHGWLVARGSGGGA